MTLVDAVAHCSGIGGLIDARPGMRDKEKKLTVLWTGALRHNASHFRRQDGLLIKPTGFKGSHQDFPAIVHVRIVTLDDERVVLEAHNSLSDAFNKADSDYCLCYLNPSGAIKQIIKHEIFFYTLALVLAVLAVLNWYLSSTAPAKIWP